jgi:hypothetical protein
VEELKNLKGYEQVVKQVYFIEKQIVADSELVAGGCFIILQYKDLSLDYIDDLSKKLGFLKRSNAATPNIDAHEKISLSKKEFLILQEAVDSLDWGFMKKVKTFRAHKKG